MTAVPGTLDTMTAPYVANAFFDFDDVVNIDGWQKPKYRHRLAPMDERLGEIQSALVPMGGGLAERIQWFDGVIEYMGSLQDRGVNVRWLSTWEKETTSLGRVLGRHFGYLPWDTYIQKAKNQTEITMGRDARKLAVVREVTESEGLPFVWTDDSAVRLWRPEDFNVPSLGVHIRRITGFDRLDAERVDSFLSVL